MTKLITILALSLYLLGLFFLSLFIQLLYWILVFLPFSLLSKKNIANVSIHQKPISVIICAKNEAHQLVKYLPYFLTQRYFLYEVIIVNDNSEDETENLILELQKEYSHLKYLKLEAHEKQLPGKRSALIKGIQFAQYEWIAVSDADCRPDSTDWLRYISEPLYRGKKIVLGYSPYKYDIGFLNLLIRYETFYTAMQYLSFTHIGLPYMGVGRNMAFTKSIFYQAAQFFSNDLPISGDDDLLVQKVADDNNTALVFHPKAHLISTPKYSYREWVFQKLRHYSAGHYYTTKMKWILGGLYISTFINSLMLLYFFLDENFHPVIVCTLALKFFILNCIAYLFKRKIKSCGAWKWTGFLDFLLPYLLITLGFISFFYKRNLKWKQIKTNQVKGLKRI